MSPPAVDAIITRSLSPEAQDLAKVLPTVFQILGRPPTPFATWATTHATLFAHA